MANNLKTGVSFSGPRASYRPQNPGGYRLDRSGHRPLSAILGREDCISNTGAGETGSCTAQLPKTACRPLATKANKLVGVDTSVYFKNGDLTASIKSGLANMKLPADQEPYAMVTTDPFQLGTGCTESEARVSGVELLPVPWRSRHPR